MALISHSLDAGSGGLLTADDPPPVRIVNSAGRSPFLLLGDHAGNRIPERLGRLGVGDHDLTRHIALDIGIQALGEMLSDRLDAVFIHQRFSRLVIDCNRVIDASDAIPPISDGLVIPGNYPLDAPARAARVAEIYEPYHTAIAGELERRDRDAMPTTVIALHSFTPIMAGTARSWDIGILHDSGDAAFALGCLAELRMQGGLLIGDNQPYRMDATDYTIPRHAYPGRRPYVEIEVRQDLLADEAGIARVTDILETTLIAALSHSSSCRTG